MRGEELQAAGWLAGQHKANHSLLVTPGTHNKWILVDNNCIESFSTSMTGELFALLDQHSILTDHQTYAHDDEAFAAGVQQAMTQAPSALLQTIFSTRSRQLNGQLGKHQASSYLSGILIGADCVAGLDLIDPSRLSKVVIIAESELAKLYLQSLQTLTGCTIELSDLEQIRHRAYQTVYAQIHTLSLTKPR